MKTRLIREYRKKIYFIGLYSTIFMALALVLDRIFAAENKTFIWRIDGLSQHVVALKYIRQYIINLFTGGKMPMVDLTLGQGFDVIGTLNYYGFGDPITLLTVLFPENQMELMYEVLIFVRMYLSGLTVAYLLKVLGRTKISAVLPASLAYAFCNYALLGGIRHPLFFNGVMYLPLLIAGVELAISKKKIKVLTIVVALSFINNYYFMYINTVMAVIYFFIRQLGEYRQNKLKGFLKRAGRIVVAYLWGSAMAAVILVPSVYAFMNNVRTTTKLAGPSLFFEEDYYKNLFYSFFVSGGNMNQWSIPGIGVVGVIALFMLLGKRTKAGKKLLFGFVVFLAMMISPSVGKFMNGFSYVTMRFSYGMALLLAVMVAFAIEETHVIYKAMPCFLVLLTITNIVINFFMIFDSSFSYNCMDYVNRNTLEKEMHSEDVQVIKNIKDKSFYRTERKRERINKSAYSNFYQTGFYYSIVPDKITDLYISTCLSDCYRAYVIQGLEDRIGMLSLASVKYYVNYKDKAPYGFEKISEDTINGKKVYLYKNKNHLPLGVTYTSYMTREQYNSLTPVERELALLNSAVVDNGKDGINNRKSVNGVKKTEMKTVEENGKSMIVDDSISNTGRSSESLKTKSGSSINYRFEGEKNSLTYLVFQGVHVKDNDQGDTSAEYLSDCNSGNMRVIGDYSDGYYNKAASVFEIGYSEKKQTKLQIKFNKDREYQFKSVYAAVVPAKEYDNAIEKLKANTLTNVKIETNKITGKISTKEKRILQLSLPYSKGYSVYVDGKKVKTFTSGIGYLGVELEKGTHSVEVKYVTYGIIPAATVSVVATLLFILQLFVDRKRKQKM